MMAEFRTKKQIDADKLDLEIFRVINQIDRFANDYRDADVNEIAMHFDAYRDRVRRHMHQKDQEATRGS
jgi:hypothetical protein